MALTAVLLTVAMCWGWATPSPLHDGGQIKVVLVAGSNGFYNYRHQADVCHAYQILHANGIPDENIVVMMYDDIANSEENPHQGVIINRPEGPNVYQGVPKDYVGKDVNKANFFNVLTGNSKAMKGIGTGRVLSSGPQDHVFINFVDHGGPGVLLMPDEEIMASEFIDVLKKMSQNASFSKMFLYIEACESGSMFDNLLPDDLNIFVMTAADPHESSYACFFDTTLNTYLGDVFSVRWMQDAETEDLSQETVNHQFEKVRTETNTSHVEEYGDIDIGSTKLNQVIGSRKTPLEKYSVKIMDAVSSHHVPVAILQQRILRAKTPRLKESLQSQLHAMLESRKHVEDMFVKLTTRAVSASNLKVNLFEEIMSKRPALTKNTVGCYEKSLKLFSQMCFNINQNPYVISHLHKLINLCESTPEEVVTNAIKEICVGKEKLFGIV